MLNFGNKFSKIGMGINVVSVIFKQYVGIDCFLTVPLLSKPLLLIVLIFAVNAGFGQQADSSGVSMEDTVYTRYGKFEMASTPVQKYKDFLSQSNKTSVLNLLNSIPGVRMEERSPGSYRINMRGSSLRSPFGVRNVDVYWNNIPLTDPGGNTYFNQLAYNSFSSMTFVKSSASTIFGSGTGGQIIIDNIPTRNNEASLEIIAGSYGLKTLLTSGNLAGKFAKHKITFARNETNGYRIQSAFRRNNISWVSDITAGKKQQIQLSVLYTNMYYQTPGALTLSQFEVNPRGARPASGNFPSAVDAKAAIFQNNLTGGITYKNQFSKTLTNSTTIYGAFNQIKNSAIRNYEQRNEPHFGGRTVFKFSNKLSNSIRIDLKTGAELRSGNFNIKVSGNRNGIPDTLQTNDDVKTTVYNLFSQMDLLFAHQWNITTAISYNKTKTAFIRLSEIPVIHQPFSFSNEVVPRFAIGKIISTRFSLSALFSKSFSPPTIAELLPSTGIINTNLKAEHGWNYELIAKANPLTGLGFEASLFSYRLKDAIVQRRDDAGADYFMNAGGAKQNGVELYTSFRFIRNKNNFIEDGKLTAAWTFSQFNYTNFIKTGNDFSGKRIPGVPVNNLFFTGGLFLKNGLNGSVSYSYSSSVFLNDANTAKASPAHLLMAKLEYHFKTKKTNWNFYLGADNLLNERYSLGYDINALGGRYYNAAPIRNFYVGAALSFHQ